jgi:hypothetical protein
MSWTVDSSGSQTATLGTEHVLDSPTTVGTYVLSVDTVNMVIGDTVELRVYDMVDGVNYRQCWKGTFQHTQINIGKESPPIAVTTQAKFTLKQIAGTFPYTSLVGTIADTTVGTGHTSGAVATVRTAGGGNVAGGNIGLVWTSGTFTNGELLYCTTSSNEVTLTNATGRAFPWSVRRI